MVKLHFFSNELQNSSYITSKPLISQDFQFFFIIPQIKQGYFYKSSNFGCVYLKRESLIHFCPGLLTACRTMDKLKEGFSKGGSWGGGEQTENRSSSKAVQVETRTLYGRLWFNSENINIMEHFKHCLLEREENAGATVCALKLSSSLKFYKVSLPEFHTAAAEPLPYVCPYSTFPYSTRFYSNRILASLLYNYIT